MHTETEGIKSTPGETVTEKYTESRMFNERSIAEPAWTLLTMDASRLGWGAHLNEIPVQGTWNAHEKLRD